MAKWNIQGLRDNFGRRNADNVTRAIVGSPELLKELSDEELVGVDNLIHEYGPQHKAKKQERKAAISWLTAEFDDRPELERPSRVTVQVEGAAEVTVTEGETVVKTDTAEVTVAPVENNFEAAAQQHEATTGQSATSGAPVQTTERGVQPDAYGNTKKGDRICVRCGIKESETLKKNPRYSFCKKMCVNCYNKVARGGNRGTVSTVRAENMTEEQIRAEIARLEGLLPKQETVTETTETVSEGGTTEGNSNDTESATVESGANEVTEDVSEELAPISQ